MISPTSFVDTFRAPAKCISDAVDELIVFSAGREADIDFADQIARVEPHIPVGERVVDDLLLGRFGVCITFEYLGLVDGGQQ